MSSPTEAKEVHTPPEDKRTRLLKTSSLAATVCVDLVAGFVAWKLVRPGESLLWPTTLVALILGAPASAWFLAIKSMGGWKSHRSLAMSVVALCVVPNLWSFFGVLPASVSWDSTAANAISAAVDGGADGCRVVSTGSVGFLIAPYKVCVTRDGVNYVIRFSTMDLRRGYAYVGGKSNLNWFPDQCARQLLPHWWAFYNNSIQTANCPFGYPGHGGG